MRLLLLLCFFCGCCCCCSPGFSFVSLFLSLSRFLANICESILLRKTCRACCLWFSFMVTLNSLQNHNSMSFGTGAVLHFYLLFAILLLVCCHLVYLLLLLFCLCVIPLMPFSFHFGRCAKKRIDGSGYYFAVKANYYYDYHQWVWMPN